MKPRTMVVRSRPMGRFMGGDSVVEIFRGG
jgi:hypothetical protein